MLKTALFCAFIPFAAMEILFYHQFGLILVGTLYIGLSLQAEMAANRLVAQGLRYAPGTRRHWSQEPLWNAEPGPELKVPPLGKKKSSSQQSYQKPLPRQNPRPAPAATRPRTATSHESQKPKQLPPNFGGRDHEVLGVSENAATRTIVRAFRHWIKRFHPDGARLPQELANRKSQQLTEAKDRMLERRKKAA
ncbi:MAG TPA: J domain-containing protein [Bdellovibrionota bacterium]|jgi:hypothetical protein